MRRRVTLVDPGPVRVRVRRWLLTLGALLLAAGALYAATRGYL